MDVLAPFVHVVVNETLIVESTAQSTTALCVWVSTDIFVKSPDSNESVILQVMRDPFDTFCERDVLVTPALTERFEFLTFQLPESILYSTL